jgi:hypothetical protein
MPDLSKAAIPLDTAASEGSLAIRLVFKFLALLLETGKIDDGDVSAIATGLIADLGSDAERAAQWRMLEQWLPDFKRDADGDSQRNKGDHDEQRKTGAGRGRRRHPVARCADRRGGA